MESQKLNLIFFKIFGKIALIIQLKKISLLWVIQGSHNKVYLLNRPICSDGPFALRKVKAGLCGF